MLSSNAVEEFRQHWLPNITDAGLDHLLEQLDYGGPLLLRNHWVSDFPGEAEPADFAMGCLATRIAWFHSATEHLHSDAGFRWLNDVAGVDSESSHVLREWDAGARVEAELAYLLREEKSQRSAQLQPATDTPNPVRSQGCGVLR